MLVYQRVATTIATPTGWGPSSLAKLVYNYNKNSV